MDTYYTLDDLDFLCEEKSPYLPKHKKPKPKTKKKKIKSKSKTRKGRK